MRFPHRQPNKTHPTMTRFQIRTGACRQTTEQRWLFSLPTSVIITQGLLHTGVDLYPYERSSCKAVIFSTTLPRLRELAVMQVLRKSNATRGANDVYLKQHGLELSVAAC